MTRCLYPLHRWVSIFVAVFTWVGCAHALEVAGNIHGRWAASDSPVIVSGDSVVPFGLSLVIEPGAQVLLAPGATLNVDGFLTALGTFDQPIRFESQMAVSPWRSIRIRATGEALMGSCMVRGGGLDAPEGLSGAIRVEGGRLNMIRCEVSGSRSSGILVSGGECVITSSRFDRNGGAQPIDAGIHVVAGSVWLGSGEQANSITNSVFGLYNHDLTPVVAHGTWWGSSTGPQHASNVMGLGVSVSDDVDFSNFVRVNPHVTPGDVDRDGDLTLLDVAIVLKVSAGLVSADAAMRNRGDVHPDGVLDLADAQAIARAVSGVRPLP